MGFSSLFHGTMSIRRLPWEILSYVAQELDLDDLFNLSLTCRHLQVLIRDNNVCRRALESRAPSATETQVARQTREFARGLRILVKRRAAISSASPYLAAIVALAESFIYTDGVLCYASDGRLRVLDLHNSAGQEHVVDIAGLVGASPRLTGLDRRRPSSELHLVHYSHGFVTCRFTHRISHPGWLVVVNLSTGRILSHPLDSANKLFVRNNDEFLYYGAHSEPFDHGERRWAVRCCSLRDERWYGLKIVLTEMVSAEVGVNICFDIIDGYFYCVANRANFEIEEIAWTSYYTYLRFPVGEPKPKSPDASLTELAWRKFHAEGPIDERWTFVRLLKDEASGAVTVIESRKEWRSGKSTSLRTFYTTRLHWPQSEGGPIGSSSDCLIGGNGQSSTGSDARAAPERWCGPKDDNTGEAGIRSPDMVHPADDTSSPPLSLLSDSYMRSYHPGCQTHLDLVNDPAPPTMPSAGPTEANNDFICSTNTSQRIRIRSGSRRLRAPSDLVQVGDAHSGLPSNPLYPEREIATLYATSGIHCWPPNQLEGQEPDNALESLYGIVSPRTHQGPVHAVWDERSMVYATDTADKALKAIVFISWDPSIRLRGVRPWLSRGGTPGGEEDTAPGKAGGPKGAPSKDGGTGTVTSAKGKERAEDITRYPRVATLPRANDGSPAAAAAAAKCTGSPAADSGTSSAGRLSAESSGGRGEGMSPSPHMWKWKESPMYEAIQMGYHFMR